MSVVDRSRALLDRAVPRSAVVLSVLTLGSYVMGLVRDRLLTRTFGAGAELDTFNAAFVIPELLFGVIIASGLAAPFVPIFTGLRRDAGDAAADAFGQTILTMAVVAMGVVAAILFLIAPLTADVVAPGFGPAQRELYVELFRIMCVTQVFFAGSMALGEVLVANRRFVFYGIAPLLYNLGIVVGTVALAGRLGILAPAIGAVLGSALHLCARVVGVRIGTSFPIRGRLAWRTRSIREFIRLMLPKTLSSPIEPITFLYFTSVASGLVAGSITTVNLARNFASVPVSLVGVAFAVAAFPRFAEAYAAGSRARFVAEVRRTTATIAALTVVAAIGLVVVGPLAIDVLLGGGRFDADDVARTALVLAGFALAVPFESLGHVLSRAIYATHHTILQVVATLIGFGITVLVTAELVDRIGVLAIPAGFAVGGGIRLALLGWVLVRRIRTIP